MGCVKTTNDAIPKSVKFNMFASILLYTSFPLIWYATWLAFRKKRSDLLTQPKGSRLCVRAKYLYIFCHTFSASVHFFSFKLNSHLIVNGFISIVPLSACKILVLNLDSWLSYCKRDMHIKGPPLETKTFSCFSQIVSVWYIRRIMTFI